MKKTLILVFAIIILLVLNYILFIGLYPYEMIQIHQLNMFIFNAPPELVVFDMISSTLPFSYFLTSILSYVIIRFSFKLNYFIINQKYKIILNITAKLLILIALIYMIFSYINILHTFQRYMIPS